MFKINFMIKRIIAVSLTLTMLLAVPLSSFASDTLLNDPEWNSFCRRKNRKG